MSTTLENKLNAIYEEKMLKIKPENIKQGITIFGVTGTMTGGGMEPLHIHRDAVEAYIPTIEFIPSDGTYTFELVDGYYQNNNQNIDNSTATCTVNVIAEHASTVQFETEQNSESHYDYGTITVSSGNTILDAKGLSGSSVITYNCPEGVTTFTIKYTKDVSASNGTDTFKFKVNALDNSVPEIDYDAYIMHTDDFETLKTDETIPVNTTVVTYNSLGLSGTGYTKQEDGTWLQVGVYHDANAKAENIKRGAIVNGVTGSYIDLSNYGGLSLNGPDIIRSDFSVQILSCSIDLKNIRLDVNNNVYCDIQNNYNTDVKCMSALNNIVIDLPKLTTVENVYLGTTDIQTFAYSQIIVAPPIQYTEVPYTIVAGDEIFTRYVEDFKLYVADIVTTYGYTASIKDCDRVTVLLQYPGGSQSLTLYNTSEVSTIYNLSREISAFEVLPMNAESGTYIGEVYYAPDDTEQHYPLILEELTSVYSYNQTSGEYIESCNIRCMLNVNGVDMTNKYVKHTYEILKDGEVVAERVHKWTYSSGDTTYDHITIDRYISAENVTVNYISAELLDNSLITITYLMQDTEGNYITPDIIAANSRISENFGDTSSYNLESVTYDWNSNPVRKIITMRKMNNGRGQHQWYRYTDWQCYDYINLTDEELEQTEITKDIMLPISGTKYTGLLQIYTTSSQHAEEAKYADVILENRITDASGNVLVPRKFTEYFYIVSDTNTITITGASDIMLPDSYSKPFKGPFHLSTKTNTLVTNYNYAVVHNPLYQANSALLHSVYGVSTTETFYGEVYVAGEKITSGYFGDGSSLWIDRYYEVGTEITLRIHRTIGGSPLNSYWETTVVIPEDAKYTSYQIRLSNDDLQANVPTE